ncbi:hypothetical protein [Kitasatospora sp. NPDC088351]|uniref:hypothetical protein n=1 Tax=Kitasatospora sp. NPDC088351 TaxID=3155180 RepID=UPI00342CEE33
MNGLVRRLVTAFAAAFGAGFVTGLVSRLMGRPVNRPVVRRPPRPSADGDRRWERRVRGGGLPPIWAARYAVLAEPSRQAAAVRHTAATLAALPGPYRTVFAALLRVFPAAVALAALPAIPGRSRDRARLRRAADRLAAVPGCAELLRVSSVLALHGALDGALDGGLVGGPVGPGAAGSPTAGTAGPAGGPR